MRTDRWRQPMARQAKSKSWARSKHRRRGLIAPTAALLCTLIALAVTLTARPVPLPSASAAVSSLGDKCAADILKQPQILSNEMNKPGKASQSININLGFDAVDPSCKGYFVRKASVLPQLVRHGQIINENPIWMPLLQGRGFNYATQAGLLDFNSVHKAERYWQPGDKVRCGLRIQEVSLATNEAIKTSVTTFPIRVK
jgi:hypothetical protein